MNVKELDLTKDKCPVNYLKAKWQLMESDEINLKLIFTDKNISETVRTSLRKDGFEVSSIENLGDKFTFYVCKKKE